MTSTYEPSPIQVSGQQVCFGSSEQMTHVADGTVDFIITSPPYWNLKDYGTLNQIGASSYREYLDRLNLVWSECFRVASENAVMIVNINSRRHQKQYYPIPFDIVGEMTEWQFWDTYIWYIPNALPQPNHYIERLFDNKFEMLLVFRKRSEAPYTFHKPRVPQKYQTADPRAHKKNPEGRCIGNIFRIPAYRPPNVKEGSYHIAAFPEELVAVMLESYTNPGDLVLDPFLGSGTTLKVCRAMQRRGIGYEINEKFRDLITLRIHEPWAVPDWKDVDIIHSSTNIPGMVKPRKTQFGRNTENGEALSLNLEE